MRPEILAALNELDATLTTIEKVMDPEELASRVRELEQQASDPTLWDNPDHAQKVTTELSSVQAQLKKLTGLRQRIDDIPVMYELAEEEGDGTELADEELAELTAEIESLEVKTMLSGEYDSREAVINIRSGAGGVDAADWAEMLMRMYVRWAERTTARSTFMTSLMRKKRVLNQRRSLSTVNTCMASSLWSKAHTG